MILAKLSFKFDNPYWLFAILVGLILALIPFFRIRKDKRYTRERIVSMILHVLILTLASFVLAGFSIHEDQTLKNDETLILIDVSDSNYHNSDEIADYINDVIEQADAKNKVGIVAFGAGEPYELKKLQSKPKVDVQSIWDLYDNPRKDEEGFIMTTGTDMASAISYSAKLFTGYEDTGVEKPLDGCRMIIISDGIETDGNATTAAGQIAAMGATIDAVYFTPKDYTDANEVQIENVEISNIAPKPLQPVEVNITVKSHKFGNGANATFKIYDLTTDPECEKPIADFVEDIDSQEQTVTTSVQFSTGGVHTIKIEMMPSVEEYDTGDYEKDSLKQNNVFYSYVVVQENSNKILIVKGAGVDATQIRSLIDEEIVGANGYEVTEVTQREAPTDLSKYGEVILMNVNSSNRATSERLPDNYDVVLNNYASNGGSVLTIGGKETYYNANMAQDKFNEFLPVSVRPKTNSNKAMVLLIDRSSGMCGEEGDNGFTGRYGKNRLQVVQEAFTQVLADGTFNKDDYVGVIFFGGNKNTPIEALQLSAASNVLGISRAVGMDITAITGGKNYLGSTDWRHALEAAAKMLQPFQAADNKHIIMITDGAGDKAEGESSNLTGYPVGGWKVYASTVGGGSIPSGTPDKCYTDYIFDKYEITTSTINVGNSLSPAASYIEFMETASELDQKKHYYYTETAQEIADAVSVECKNIPTKIINEGTPDQEKEFYLKLQGNEMTNLAADADLPALNGYNGVSAKDKAGILIKTGDDPIYAEWEYGKGRVGSLMTNLSSNWGQALIAEGETEGRAIIEHIIRKNFKSGVSGMTSDMNVEFSQKNFTTTITIKDISKQGILPTDDGGKMGFIESYYHSPSDNLDPTNDKKPNGTVMSPEEYINYLCPFDAPDYKYDSMVFAAGTFTSEFRMMEPGLYTVSFLRLNSNQEVLDATPPYAYVTFSYSEEYDTYYDAELSRSTLADICNSANGEVYYPEEDGSIPSIFSDEAQFSSRTIDPVFGLMLAALILFILDVCARKFHFPLPHDLFKKKKEENA